MVYKNYCNNFTSEGKNVKKTCECFKVLLNLYIKYKNIHSSAQLPVELLNFEFICAWANSTRKQHVISTFRYILARLPRARSKRGTEPHTHGIWSTSFRLVVT